MMLSDSIICRIANVTRRKSLRRLDPLLRFIHNPDKRKKHSIKRTIYFAPETELFKKRYMKENKILAVNKTKNIRVYL